MNTAMIALIFYWIGAFIGAAIAWIVCRPMKAWEDGYEDAKKFYSNYDKGFKTGWDEAKKIHTDWTLGFNEGWDAAMKRKEEVSE